MSSPSVSRAHLTFIWVETTLSLLKKGKLSPFSFVAGAGSYIPRFEQLQTWINQEMAGPNPDPDGLTLPWDKVAGQRFWTRYLNRYPQGQGSASGGEAWKSIVPFREKLKAKVSAEWLPAKVLVEGFYYPHGVAAMVTFTVRLPEPRTLEATVELCRDIRKRRKLTYTPRGEAAKDMPLDALGSAVLTLARERSLGEGAAPGVAASAPFSLVTMIELQDADPDAPVAQGDAVHKLLEAVTGWQEPVPPLGPIAQRIVSGPVVDPVNLLYAGRRGRAIWSPYFAIKPADSDAPEKSKHTLGCYHRNLAYASMQVESLARLAVATNAEGFQGDVHRDIARFAGGILGRMYGGDETVYRARSCQRHLEDNNWLDDIDKIRTQFPPMGKVARKDVTPPPKEKATAASPPNESRPEQTQ
jgi:hypothetical protein